MINQLAENDQHFAKANAVLGEGGNNLNAFNYDLAICRSQEAFELYLKPQEPVPSPAERAPNNSRSEEADLRTVRSSQGVSDYASAGCAIGSC